MNFISQTFIKEGNLLYYYPSDAAVERFISDVRETILTAKKSQRDLIVLVNQKLRGWASYHRFSDAEKAFRKVDAAVQAALLEAATAKHPRMAMPKLIAKYWYKEPSGRHIYALPEDKSVYVIRLADTLLIHHRKIKTNANPYLERDYIESRTHERDIHNVNGPYRGIWERQDGKCFYCGRPILPDQPRTVVQMNLSKVPSLRNSAYIHKLCAQNEFEVLRTMEDVTQLRPYDVLAALDGIQAEPASKEAITPDWRFFALKEKLARSDAASITLSFKDIERITGSSLPAFALKSKGWWYPRKDRNTIAEAWIQEGYRLERIDLEKKRLTLKREEFGMSHLQIPKALTGKIPDNARIELETFMAHIIKKYRL